MSEIHGEWEVDKSQVEFHHGIYKLFNELVDSLIDERDIRNAKWKFDAFTRVEQTHWVDQFFNNHLAEIEKMRKLK